jgi:alpha-tubulin suppressor-like RCC1 family protein
MGGDTRDSEEMGDDVGSAMDAEAAPDASDAGAATVRFVDVTAGQYFACALTDDGQVLCWGWNRSRVVTSEETQNAPPTWSFDDLRFEMIAGGGERACGVTTGGDFMCWGDNSDASIRDDIDDPWFNPPTPVELPTQQPITQIALGSTNPCVLLGDGRVLCWGPNDEGLIQEPKSAESFPPTETISSADSLDLSAAHACTIRSGTIRCWGTNHSHRVSPTRANGVYLSPTPVDGTSSYSQVGLGVSHTCGLRQTGKVTCWGSASAFKLGVPGATITADDMPVEVPGVNDATELAAGWTHTCALTGGEARCWGSWKADTDDTLETFSPPDGSEFVTIAAGSQFTCATTSSGRLYCWGENRNFGTVGQFTTSGEPEEGPFSEPTPVLAPELPSE